MFSRTALALALLAGSVSADLSAYPGQTLYASDSSGHCYKYITGTSLDQDADNIAGCSAAGFVSENSLGSMSSSSAATETFSNGDGTCYNGGSGRAASVTYNVDNSLTSMRVDSVVESPMCYYSLTLTGPEDIAATAASAAAAAESGGSCFHGESLVALEDKTTKPFTELQLGDKIMTAGADGATFSFTSVHTLPHKAGNSEMAKFLQLTTESGKTVRMTPGHLIPKCDGVTVGASTLVVGDCLFTISGKETLMAIATSLKFGVYTAVTKNKFIVVDGIVASPFSLENDSGRAENLKKDLLNKGVKGALGELTGDAKTLLRGAAI